MLNRWDVFISNQLSHSRLPYKDSQDGLRADPALSLPVSAHIPLSGIRNQIFETQVTLYNALARQKVALNHV